MANNPPIVSVANKTVAPGTSISLSQLFSYFDPDAGDSVTGFAVQDRSAGGGHLFLNGVQQADNTVFGNTLTGIPISQIGQWTFVAGPSGSVDSIGFNAIDSHNAFNNPGAIATVTAQSTNNPPVVTVTNKTVAAGTSIALSQLFAWSDPDSGDSVTGFAVQDKSSGGGHLFLNGVQQADNTVFGNTLTGIPISQISQWTFVAGPSGSVDSIGFNAIDSHNAFNNPGATATVTVPAAPANNPPTVTVTNKTVTAGTSIALSQLFAWSDPDAGDSVTGFAVQDKSAGGGHLFLNGVQQADNTVFGNTLTGIPISQIGQWTFVAGPSGSVDQIGFNAIDSHNAFNNPGATATVTVSAAPANNPPVVTVTNKTVAAGTSIALSQLFAWSDPDAGDSVTGFAVQDKSAGGGHLFLNGVQQADNTVFGNTLTGIPISQIGQWTFVAGASGSVDNIGFNAIDSHNAFNNPGATATVTTSSNNPPIVAVHNQTIAPGTAVSLSTLFTYSDPDAGDSVTGFAVQDRTNGGGHLYLNGIQQSENTVFGNTATGIPISQIGQWTFVAGPSGSVDQIGFNAIDSHTAFNSPGAIASVTAAGTTNQPPVVTGASNLNFQINQTIPGSQLYTSASDPDGSVATIRFWDSTSGTGHLTFDGVQIAGGFVDVAPAQISRVAYVTGSSAGTNDIVVEAFDNRGLDSNDLAVHISIAAPGSNLAPVAALTWTCR